MKFISIKLKNNFVEYFIVIFLTLFSFFICYHFGYDGIVPLDDFVNFNCGYRILSGDIPFKDYYSVTGLLVCSMQSFFYKFFGTNWSSLVLHAAFMNTFICLNFYFFLNRLKITNSLILIFCLSISILAYPNNGVPGVDHHSWILSICSFLFFYLSFKEKNKKFIIFSTVLLFLSFLVKQVPSTYFLILFFCLYSFNSIKDKKIYFFKELSLVIFFCILILFFFLRINSISFDIFFEQYILLSLDLGSNRFENINISFILEKISNNYFVIFLIIPLTINLYYILSSKNKFSDKYLIANFLIIFSLIFISLFYEIHTNNSVMTFIILPVIIVFLYKIQGQIKEKKFLQYIYLTLTFYSWFRLFQFDASASLFHMVVVLILFFISNYKKINFLSIQNLMVVYLIFSTFYYYQTSIKFRKYKDLSLDNKIYSFDGSKINNKFKNVKWSTSYRLKEKDEIESFNFKINLIKTLKDNFIFITDYQIFNSILGYKDYSPVKYWHTGVSYPEKQSKYRIKFENFFRNKIINNNVKYIIIDDKASVFKESIKDYKFLQMCSKVINKDNLYNIKMYQLNKLCLKNFSN